MRPAAWHADGRISPLNCCPSTRRKRPVNPDEMIARLQQQLDDAPKHRQDGKLQSWTTETATLLRLFLGEDNDNYKTFQKIRYTPNYAPASEQTSENMFQRGVEKGRSLISAAITEIEITRQTSPKSGTATPESEAPALGTDIFLVHGRDEVHKLKVVDFIQTVTGRRPITLSEQPGKGRTLIEKFEQEGGRAAFGVVVATADDIGRAKTDSKDQPRARQNVILEWGFFAGRLGRSRTTLLYESDVELPSDINGLNYISLDSAGAWRVELGRELAAAGIEIDMDKLVGS